MHPLSHAQQQYDGVDDSPASTYTDNHAWTFTPKSFELLMLELNLLGHIDWAIRDIAPAPAIEFYIWLEKRRIAMPEADINPRRLSLLTEMVYETREALAQLDEAAGRVPSPAAVADPAPPSGRLLPDQIEIELANGARVRVGNDVGLAALKGVLAALQG
jgi:hypothetical protein